MKMVKLILGRDAALRRPRRRRGDGIGLSGRAFWHASSARFTGGDGAARHPYHACRISISERAFSLLEVMIAVGIFFLATFTILDLISTSLAGARRLQRPMVDASALLSQMSLTNQLVEGSYSGNLADALGKNYSSYRWVGEITEVGSNKLFMADFAILPASGGGGVISRSSTLFYRPQSPAGSMDGGNFIHK